MSMNERLTGEQDSRIWRDEIQQINHIHEGTNFDFSWRTWLMETNLEPASDTSLIEVSKNVKWRAQDGERRQERWARECVLLITSTFMASYLNNSQTCCRRCALPEPVWYVSSLVTGDAPLLRSDILAHDSVSPLLACCKTGGTCDSPIFHRAVTATVGLHGHS